MWRRGGGADSCDCKYEGFYCFSCKEQKINEDPDYQTDECPVCGRSPKREVDDIIKPKRVCDRYGCYMNTDHLWAECWSCFCRFRTQSQAISQKNFLMMKKQSQCPNCNNLFYPRNSYRRDGSLFNGLPLHFYLLCYSCNSRAAELDWPDFAGWTISHNLSIVRSGDNIIGWDDEEIFFRFHCDRYVPPRSRKQSYDGCEEMFFVAMRYNPLPPWGGPREERMSPREYFDFISELCRSGSMDKSQEIRYRRLERMPNVKTQKTSESWGPTRGDDFQKGDFKKGDFQKGDFKKG